MEDRDFLTHAVRAGLGLSPSPTQHLDEPLPETIRLNVHLLPTSEHLGSAVVEPKVVSPTASLSELKRQILEEHFSSMVQLQPECAKDAVILYRRRSWPEDVRVADMGVTDGERIAFDWADNSAEQEWRERRAERQPESGVS